MAKRRFSGNPLFAADPSSRSKAVDWVQKSARELCRANIGRDRAERVAARLLHGKKRLQDLYSSSPVRLCNLALHLQP